MSDVISKLVEFAASIPEVTELGLPLRKPTSEFEKWLAARTAAGGGGKGPGNIVGMDPLSAIGKLKKKPTGSATKGFYKERSESNFY
jgi:hypothetical protein